MKKLVKSKYYYLPRIPFGLALKIQHSGTFGIDVANRGLFVKAVDFLQFVIGHCLVDFIAGSVPPSALFTITAEFISKPFY